MSKLWVHQDKGVISVSFNGNFIGYVDEKLMVEMNAIGLNHFIPSDISSYLRSVGSIYCPPNDTIEVLWTSAANTLTISKSIKDKLAFMAHDYK